MGKQIDVMSGLTELASFYGPASRGAMPPALRALWERFDTSLPMLAEAIEALSNVTASLDTVMAQFGSKMHPEDQRSREARIAEALAALAALSEPQA